jgi:hypothetical protein
MLIINIIITLILAEIQQVETWEHTAKDVLCPKLRHYLIMCSYYGIIRISESRVNAEMFAAIKFWTIRINSHCFKTTELSFRFMYVTEVYVSCGQYQNSRQYAAVTWRAFHFIAAIYIVSDIILYLAIVMAIYNERVRLYSICSSIYVSSTYIVVVLIILLVNDYG